MYARRERIETEAYSIRHVAFVSSKVHLYEDCEIWVKLGLNL